MTTDLLLEKVKNDLKITIDYHNEDLKSLIEEVKFYLLSAGVSQSVIDSDKSVGVIVRGVSDLWNTRSDNARYSEYFYQRAEQLRSFSSSGGSSTKDTYTKEEIDEMLKNVAYDVVINKDKIYLVNEDNQEIGTTETIPQDPSIKKQEIDELFNRGN